MEPQQSVPLVLQDSSYQMEIHVSIHVELDSTRMPKAKLVNHAHQLVQIVYLPLNAHLV